jgi:glycosyltransferase involved in cell wall biosynthesis
MTLLAISVAALLCALSPAVLFCINLRTYRRPAAPNGQAKPDGLAIPAVSILIPARNEAHGIGQAVRCALASVGADCEVVVMDDHSTDATAAIVQAIAADDARVRLEYAPALPAGWNGKQHACWALAHTARNPLLCFVDADVRLAPEAVSRMAAQLLRGPSSLISGFPQQITGTPLEWMLLPLIHFVLLGFLPMSAMRKTTDPSFAAGCGQFLLVRREDYFSTGGHSQIKTTMHDGLLLPRLFREHGLKTDLADLTEFATCRMYTSARQVWQGLAKNATEGIAAPVRILPISLLLILGQIVPFVLLAWLPRSNALIASCILVAVAGAWLPRLLAIRLFRQDWRGALLHPLGIALLLAVQWYALGRQVLGSPVSWKDRAYAK